MREKGCEGRGKDQLTGASTLQAISWPYVEWLWGSHQTRERGIYRLAPRPLRVPPRAINYVALLLSPIEGQQIGCFFIPLLSVLDGLSLHPPLHPSMPLDLIPSLHTRNLLLPWKQRGRGKKFHFTHQGNNSVAWLVSPGSPSIESSLVSWLRNMGECGVK